MRVLIIPTPPPAEAPVTSGIAKYLTTLARHLPEDIQTVTLDAQDAAYGNPYTTPPAREPCSVGAADAGQSGAPAGWRILVWYAREAWRLAAVLRRYRKRADIIHVNLVGCEIQTVAARLAGFRRVVTTIHNLPGEDREALAWPRRCIEWLSFACGSHHIGVSESVCAFWQQRIGLSPRKCSVIYLGIEPVTGLCAPPPRREAATRFGISARLHPMKGHAVLLEAFERVVAIHPASRLLIAGAGPEEPSIRALIERLGLGSAVTMLGHVDDPLAFLVGLDVHVLPSVTLESLGYSVVEAMHAGVPSVVSDVGGAKEIIGASGGGLIVGARDVEALAAALCQYVEHPEERRQAGERARRYAQEHLTAERMALLTAGVYRKVTGVPQGRRG